MDLTIEILLDFVFDDLEPRRQSEVKAIIDQDPLYQDIIAALQELKKELPDKPAVRKWLAEKGKQLSVKFSDWRDRKKSE